MCKRLRADVVVSEVQPGQSEQQGEFFRKISDLVVSQF